MTCSSTDECQEDVELTSSMPIDCTASDIDTVIVQRPKALGVELKLVKKINAPITMEIFYYF